MRSVEISDGEILLRRARMSEARQLAQAVQVSLREMEPWLSWATQYYNVEAARAFLEFTREEERQGRGLHLSIFAEASGTLIGGVGLIIRMQMQHAEIGYWLRTDYTGRGYSTQAAGLLMDYGFRKLELRRIHLTCDVRNRASLRVAEKLGMRREGRLKEYLLSLGRPSDHFLYAILSHEFKR